MQDQTDTAAEPAARRQFIEQLYGLLDITRLEPADPPARIRDLCEKVAALRSLLPALPPPAAVCVYPAMVSVACPVLKACGIGVASVACDFPSGEKALEEKLTEVHLAMNSGAKEIDMVFSRRAFMAGLHREIRNEITAVRKACGDKALLKVILENCELGSSEDERQRNIGIASRLAIECGADFIKTSTGKGAFGARPQDIAIMLDAIAQQSGARRVGIKAAGGVRTPAQAAAYFEQFRAACGGEIPQPEYFRIGASGLAGALLAEYSTLSGAAPIPADYFDSGRSY